MANVRAELLDLQRRLAELIARLPDEGDPARRKPARRRGPRKVSPDELPGAQPSLLDVQRAKRALRVGR